MDARVKIKMKKSSSAKVSLLGICNSNSVKVSRVIEVVDGYLLFCSSISDLDTLFSSKVQTYLSALSMECVIPPQLRARRSVIIKRVDNVAYDHSTEEIKDEIRSKNSWADIVDLYKFPHSKTIKVQFSNFSVAQRCLRDGLSFFYLHISGDDMHLDEFFPVTTCYRCYTLEDHTTSTCPKAESYRVCSVCASEGHIWRECSSNVKKCINCSGNHNTMSMQCIKRKDIVKSKRLRKTQEHTYTDAVKSIPALGVAADGGQLIAKSVSCIVLALIKSSDNNSVFADTVNALFAANSLPKLNLTGFDVDCSSVLHTMSSKTVSAGPISPIDDESSVATDESPKRYKYFKIKSTTVKNIEDMLNAFDNGKIVITHPGGNVVDYKTATGVIKACRSSLPAFVDVKPSEFESLCASPSRYLRGRTVKK